MMRLLLLLMVAPLAACANSAVRPAALATMKLTQDFKTELTTFDARQSAELSARRRSIGELGEVTSISAAETEKQRLDWRAAGDKDAVALFEELSRPRTSANTAALDGLALLTPPEPASAPASIAYDASRHDALLKALKPLTEKSRLGDARFLLGYGRAVADQMKKDLEEAAEETATQ